MKSKNIHILPTDKPSRLVKQKYDTIDRLCLADIATKRAEYKRFNLYITSNEEIKEGDWYYDTKDLESLVPIYQRSQNLKFYSGCKKIILTTDQDLIKDGVKELSERWVEYIVINPKCEYLEVTERKVKKYDGTTLYKIIIPKEEPKFENSIENTINVMSIANSMFGTKEELKQCCDSGVVNDFCINTLKCKYATEKPKQETLEEAAEKLISTLQDYDSKRFTKAGFKLGAKWQAERMYSEEEVLDILREFYKVSIKEDFPLTNTIPLWFEQFKKK